MLLPVLAKINSCVHRAGGKISVSQFFKRREVKIFLLLLLATGTLVFFRFNSSSSTIEYIKPPSYEELLNGTDFEQSVSYFNCNESQSSLLLIYIFSHPRNFYKRSLIRHTYGDLKITKQHNFSTVFVLGQSELVDVLVTAEGKLFRDLVVVPIQDTYSNLTLKSVLWLHWLRSKCKSVRYLVKTDDDVFVNIYPVLNYVKNSILRTDDKLHCDVWKGSKVDRNKDSKYYVSYREFPNATYVDYCYGTFAVYRRELADALYDAVWKTPRMTFIEDVQTFGYVRASAGIGLKSLRRYHDMDGIFDEGILKNQIWFAHVWKRSWEGDWQRVWKKLHEQKV